MQGVHHFGIEVLKEVGESICERSYGGIGSIESDGVTKNLSYVIRKFLSKTIFLIARRSETVSQQITLISF